tara:strand:- start:8036 stop:8449 length:414 start_codon:yes stop_codon:yes gene_type:complete
MITESKGLTVVAHLDHIYSNVQHERLLVYTVVPEIDGKPAIVLPPNSVKNNTFIANISMSAAKHILYDRKSLSFEARFDGKVFSVVIPTNLIVKIVATNGKDVAFESFEFPVYYDHECEKQSQEQPKEKPAGLRLVK